jgi:hypothetical protein
MASMIQTRRAALGEKPGGLTPAGRLKVMRDQAPRHLDPHHVLENTFPEIQAP